MFEKIGHWVVKNRWLIILFWLVLAIFFGLKAPSLSEVGTNDEASFLPTEAESIRAKELIKEKFAVDQSEGEGVIVFYNESGLKQEDKYYVEKIVNFLTSEQKPKEVKDVTSIFNQPEAEAMFVSPDQTTMLVKVSFDTLSFDKSTTEAVKEIRAQFNSAPEGLKVHFTGSAGIGADLSETIEKSIDLTTIATIILVVVLLLIIYRSPVASLVPLITISFAFIISRGTLGLLAQSGWKISSMLDSFLIVLIFGAGTDYCLFIVSRLREELAKKNHKHQAVTETMSKIGAVITASAATVIVGLLGLSIASFGMVKTIGPALAIAIGITLLAGLTLTPALMSVFGHKLFWPFPEVEKPHKPLLLNWEKIAEFISRYAKVIVPIVIILFLLPYFKLSQTNQSFDILSEMPENMDSTQGFKILTDHFSQGEMMPLTLVIQSPDKVLGNTEILTSLDKINAELSTINGVDKVESLVAPNGKIQESPFLIHNQLQLFSQEISQIKNDPNILRGDKLTSGQEFQMFADYFRELSQTYPELKNNQDMRNIQTILNSLNSQMQIVSSLPAETTLPQTVIYQLTNTLNNLNNSILRLQTLFVGKESEYFYPQSLNQENSQFYKLTNLFVSADKSTTRLYIVLNNDPYSNQAFETVSEIREKIKQILPATALAGSEGLIAGPTAEFTDIEATINRDFNQVMLIVILGVFLILILLLRSLVAPLYLMASVLLSYGATLGIITWLFQDVFHQGGVSYTIPILLFVLLVALGADYNIFLSSRIREESEKFDLQIGVKEATAKTGAIITACGLILAGTFATLAFAPLQTMFQIGLAVGIGILLDTFIVRAVLVPAIATLLGKWNWWPSKVRNKKK